MADLYLFKENLGEKSFNDLDPTSIIKGDFCKDYFASSSQSKEYLASNLIQERLCSW